MIEINVINKNEFVFPIINKGFHVHQASKNLPKLKISLEFKINFCEII